MFDHVIAGFDGRDGGRDAIALAVALRPRRLTILMAYGPDTMVAPTMSSDYWDVLRDSAEQTLATACAQLGVGAEAVAVADTSAAGALHRAATDAAADLLVVGSAHRGRVGRLLIGDVAGTVLGDAPCAVAVAPAGLRETAWAPRRIGVAFDGSPAAIHALQTAAAVAHDQHAQLTVFTAWHEPPLTAADYPYSLDRAARAAEQHARHVLDDGLARAGAAATGHLLHGATHAALREATADVDLMVVGSRGWGPARRVLLGSTSHRLVHEGRCPVLVVPRATAAEPTAPAPVAGRVTAAPVL